MPKVVTCLLEHDGKILILKRSEKVGTYRGLWGGVAGFVEEGEEPQQTTVKEIREEVSIGVEKILLLHAGTVVEYTDIYEGKTYDWVIYPFLFHCDDPAAVRLDWEHTEYRWIEPDEIEHFQTVPHLKEVLSMLLEVKFWMGKRGGVVRRREKNKDKSPSSD